MTAQWICPLICEYPIHCLRPPQIAGGHLTSALKAKQPCSWKNTFIPRSVVRRAALDCCDNAPRLREGSQRASALSCAYWARLPTPHDALVFKKKGEKKKKHLAMTVLSQDATSKSSHTRSLPSDGWDSRRPLDESDPFFGGSRPDLRLAISPPTCGMHEYRPRRVLIPDPRATRGRHALKQEVDEIKRTNQIAVPGD